MLRVKTVTYYSLPDNRLNSLPFGFRLAAAGTHLRAPLGKYLHASPQGFECISLVSPSARHNALQAFAE
jgi:hypothetical protein